MDLGLAGKKAIVTGASDGIGKAAAYRMAAEGASVALVSRTASDLEAVAAEISGETGSTVFAAPADVSDEVRCEERGRDRGRRRIGRT